jgi:hypothetical protein
MGALGSSNDESLIGSNNNVAASNDDDLFLKGLEKSIMSPCLEIVLAWWGQTHN